MNINKNCRLFLRDVYSYDISACHYNVLKSINYDISKIDKEDKLKRNIQIGLLMRDNPKLTSIIRTTTESLINEYILRNKISDRDIVIRQYDGFITTKLLKGDLAQYIPIELRSIFISFIISVDRTKFIATDGNQTTIKGISYRYDEMDKIYKKILSINFANKNSIFVSLQNIKNEILKSTDPLLYCIPSSEKKFNIFLKQYGKFEISDSMTRILDTDDIDKEKYFDFYIRPFFESIVIEFINERKYL
jgi:hypothetical protein